MPSIFQLALGADFDRLHPQLQRRFGFASSDGTACLGLGVMERIWRRGRWTVPFLALGARRHVLFPEQGSNVPFVIENYAYVDSYGRETLTFVRTFEIAPARRRRFDAAMIFNTELGGIVDYLGTHQHQAFELWPSVDQHGALRIRSGRQYRRVGRMRIRIPKVLSGAAQLYEWYDDERQCFGIDVRISNPWLGPLFGYRGSFTTTYLDTRSAPVPAAARPLREEVRC